MPLGNQNKSTKAIKLEHFTESLLKIKTKHRKKQSSLERIVVQLRTKSRCDYKSNPVPTGTSLETMRI